LKETKPLASLPLDLSPLSLFPPGHPRLPPSPKESKHAMYAQPYDHRRESAQKKLIRVPSCETWVPMGLTDQGPRGPCQVDPTCQKPCRPASGPGDLIHNPGDLGRPRTTLSRSQMTYQACGASLSLDHSGGTANRPVDREILSVITEGDLPKICN
jgi:hypothetical protein